MKSDITIINCLLAQNRESVPISPLSYITVRGDIITDTGTMDEYLPPTGGTILDVKGQLAMPGLVNGHCHAAMTLFRGFADDLDLATWLQDHIFPAEAQFVSEEMVYWCSKLAAAEMVLSGTTTVANGYFFEHAAARAFTEVGIRAVTAQAVLDFPVPGIPDPGQALTVTKNFIHAWQAASPLITPAIFAHAPYTCSPKTLRKAKQLADAAGVPFFIHLAETKNEIRMIANPQGDTPTQHLHAIGILGANTVCVHGVWCTPSDLDILAETGCAVIVCPQSHAKLASGMAPMQAMLERTIRVGLGTDSSASNNSLDLFREMDFCAKVQKIACNSAVAVPARTILNCATVSGIASLCPDADIGKLLPGQKADIILLDIQQPHLQPLYTLDTLVYSGGGADVQTVLINGKIVVLDRVLQTCDLLEIRDRVHNLACQLCNL